MYREKLKAFAKEAAKGITTEQDLNDFRQVLTKITVEAALNAELEEHLGYRKHEPLDSNNCRNGYTLFNNCGEFLYSSSRSYISTINLCDFLTASRLFDVFKDNLNTFILCVVLFNRFGNQY